MNVGVEEHR